MRPCSPAGVAVAGTEVPTRARARGAAGIPFAEQRLLLGGKQLPDSPTLAALAIAPESRLHLVLSTPARGEHAICPA